MFFSRINESLFLYKKVFANSLDPSLIFDEKGRINYINKTLLEISDYKAEELKGKSINFLVPEEEKERLESVISELIKEKCSFRDFETFLKGKNNKKIPTSLTILPLLEEDEIIGGLAIFVDIRQLKGLLRGLDMAKSELEGRVKERTKELEKKTKEAEKKTEELKKIKEELEESRNILKVKVMARTKELRELNEDLERKVRERTEQLQERLDELNKWFSITVGRELKMAELKEEIEILKKRIKSAEKNKEKKTEK
jgi:PAS domain S-box-containing protein